MISDACLESKGEALSALEHLVYETLKLQNLKIAEVRIFARDFCRDLLTATTFRHYCRLLQYFGHVPTRFVACSFYFTRTDQEMKRCSGRAQT